MPVLLDQRSWFGYIIGPIPMVLACHRYAWLIYSRWQLSVLNNIVLVVIRPTNRANKKGTELTQLPIKNPRIFLSVYWNAKSRLDQSFVLAWIQTWAASPRHVNSPLNQYSSLIRPLSMPRSIWLLATNHKLLITLAKQQKTSYSPPLSTRKVTMCRFCLMLNVGMLAAPQRCTPEKCSNDTQLMRPQ